MSEHSNTLTLKPRVTLFLTVSILASLLLVSRPGLVSASENLALNKKQRISNLVKPTIFNPIFPVGPGIYEDSNVNWFYVGKWSVSNNFKGSHLNTFRHTNDPCAKASILFTGQEFLLKFKPSHHAIRPAIYIDGNTLSEYNASVIKFDESSFFVSGLRFGIHDLTIRSDDPSEESISIDSLEVFSPPAPLGIGLYDERHPNWTFTGNWTRGTSSDAFTNTLAWSNDLSASASIQINGTAFRLRYTRSTNRGVHSVFVDGVKVADLNANSSTVAWQSVYEKTGLSSGVHTIEIRHGGPSGSFIDIDAIEIFSP